MQNAVTVLGLGNMGHALAGRLAGQGVAVTGWSRSGGDARAAEHSGYRLTVDLAEAVASSDILLTSLFDDCAVEAVAKRLSALTLPGKLIVETSTIDPKTLRRVAPDLQAKGAAVIDAPISGGPDMIAAGTIGIFLGGAADDVARFTPVAERLSNRFAHIGELGAGYATKIMNNVALGGATQALIEALKTGQALGLSKETMLAVLEKGPAITPMLKDRLPKIRGDDVSVGFSLDGAVVDSELFVAVTRAAGVELTVVPELLKSYQIAVEAGHGAKDLVSVVPSNLGWI